MYRKGIENVIKMLKLIFRWLLTFISVFLIYKMCWWFLKVYLIFDKCKDLRLLATLAGQNDVFLIKNASGEVVCNENTLYWYWLIVLVTSILVFLMFLVISYVYYRRSGLEVNFFFYLITSRGGIIFYLLYIPSLFLFGVHFYNHFLSEFPWEFHERDVYSSIPFEKRYPMSGTYSELFELNYELNLPSDYLASRLLDIPDFNDKVNEQLSPLGYGSLDDDEFYTNKVGIYHENVRAWFFIEVVEYILKSEPKPQNGDDILLCLSKVDKEYIERILSEKVTLKKRIEEDKAYVSYHRGTYNGDQRLRGKDKVYRMVKRI